MATASHSRPTTQSKLKTNWQRYALAGITAIAFFVLASLAWTFQQSYHTVIVVVNGSERQLRTRAANATALFEQAGYQLQPEDKLIAPAGNLTSGARISLERARPVLIEVDGIQHEHWTQAETVGNALANAGITLGWRDEIYLDLELVTEDTQLPAAIWEQPQSARPHMPWEQTTEPLQFTVKRAVPITLLDGGALPATLYTTASTLSEALEVEEVPIFQGDVVFPPLSSAVVPGQKVVINRSVPIEVTVDHMTTKARTRQPTVGAVLAELGITVFGMDKVKPELHRSIQPYTNIVLTRIREEVVYEEELIPFDTVWEPNENLPIDQRRIDTSGHPGVLRHRYRVRFENDEEMSRKLEDSWVATDPETKVIAYGTKIEPKTLETADGTITYWRKIRMYATSYSPKRSGTPRSAAWYGRTRLGKQLEKGVVAVDPGVINMRQSLYVPGYGEAMAADTGGGVVGKHIDLGYSDHDYRSWHWWTDVYLLWPPPEAYSIHYVLPNWPRYPDNG